MENGYRYILRQYIKSHETTLLKIRYRDLEEYVSKNFKEYNLSKVSTFLLKKQKEKKLQVEKYENNHIRKTIRFTEDEYTIIEKKINAVNIDFSNFAKSTLLDKQIKTKIEQKYLVQLSKIGTNLNQIAKAVNIKLDDDTATFIIQQLVNIEKAIKNDNLLQ
ncbi:MAG: hypothetical protein DRG78_12150 [Epsilonproteobacteria bacterium]|nr:MAG: hypothetical protein DRG78_12150 [Campylobacterota bacterium]